MHTLNAFKSFLPRFSIQRPTMEAVAYEAGKYGVKQVAQTILSTALLTGVTVGGIVAQEGAANKLYHNPAVDGITQILIDTYKETREAYKNFSAQKKAPRAPIDQAANMAGFNTELDLRSTAVKRVRLAVSMPVCEEVFFRGFLQGILLHRIAESLITRLAPGKALVIQSPMIQAARILLTSAAFSGAHLSNLPSRSQSDKADEVMKFQLVNTFLVGIATGTLKESRWGLTGAVIYHIAHNAAIVYVLQDIQRAAWKPGGGDLGKELTVENISDGWKKFQIDVDLISPLRSRIP